MGPPVLLVDQQALGVELLDRCLDGIVDAFLVQVEALGLQELEDVLLLLVAAALSDVDLLSGSDADLGLCRPAEGRQRPAWQLSGLSSWHGGAGVLYLSQNIRRGMRANALECKVNNGNLPLGYCKGPDGRFAIEPAGAEIVRDVFAMYLDGMSPTEICAELNARGLRTSRGARYNKNSLRVMLRNERYVGVYEYGDVRIEGGVPAIITKETFDMAQEIIAKNARAPAASWSRVDYLLTGRLFCGKCGSPMVGESGTSKTGAKHNYYICATKKRRRACDKKTVRKEWIEELVVRETLQRVLVDDVIERIADAVVDLQRREQEEGEIPILQKQLAEVERSLKNVMTAIEQGIITQTTKARLEELEEQRRQISDRIEAVRFETPELSREQIIYWLEKFRGGDATDPAFQWKVIENFVNAVYLYDDQIRIVYNYTKQGAETVDLNFVEGLAEASGDGFGFGARCSTKNTEAHFRVPLYFWWGYFILPSPAMRAVISSMRSSGNGGSHRGLMAMDMSFMGLSSAATRLELSAPQRLQRWMIAHSPPLRTQTATGSMMPPQSAARSPGSMSTCRLERQLGQWLRWSLPASCGVPSRPQTLQVKVSLQGWVL